jgi:hypothetical protein
VPGDVAGEHLAEARLDEAPEMAGDVLPALDARTLLAVLLHLKLLHPLDPLIDDLGDGLAVLALARVALAHLLDQRCRVLALQR